MTRLIGVYGASGSGRGIMPLLRAQYQHTELVFIDDAQAPGRVNGHEIIDWTVFLAREKAGLSQPVPEGYCITNTSERVVNLILGTAKLSNGWDGIRSNDLR